MNQVRIYFSYDRQSNLKLIDDDKSNIIWKYQADLLKESSLSDKILNLSFFKSNKGVSND
jgi:hypothetical protein